MFGLISFCRVAGGYRSFATFCWVCPGLHVIRVQRAEERVAGGGRVRSTGVLGRPGLRGDRAAHNRQQIELIDAPCFTTAVRVWW